VRGVAALIVGVLSSLGAARADTLASLEEDQTALYDRIAPGVAVLSAGRAIGAGFAVAPGLLLTAAHVVDGAAGVDVLLRDGRSVRGEVIERAASGLDLALVRIPAEPPSLPLAPSDGLRPGSVVATVGHPDGNRFTLGTGVVAQAAADGPDPTLVRLQLPLRQGASGGPVVDRHGRVVGVVTLGASGTVAFAIRTEVALASLRGLDGVVAAAARRPPADRTDARAAAPQPAEAGDTVPLVAQSASTAGGAGPAEAEPAPPVQAPELVPEEPLRAPVLVGEVRAARRLVAGRPAPGTVAAPRQGPRLVAVAAHRPEATTGVPAVPAAAEPAAAEPASAGAAPLFGRAGTGLDGALLAAAIAAAVLTLVVAGSGGRRARRSD
jgi:S1-C subfamily serine protease